MSTASAPLKTALRHNPAGWPPALLPVFERLSTVQYASLTRTGQPITFPCTPYVGDDGRTLDVSTGLTYPAKAERARRNPKVALLYSDALGSGLTNPPVVLVQGLATVRDADLQWGTDRYVALSMAKSPAAYKGQPKVLLRTLGFYLARIWIQVTPMRILWWPNGLDAESEEWLAPEGTSAPPSDPAPRGKQPPAWVEPPADWRAEADRVVRDLPMRDLSWVGEDGYPLLAPVAEVQAEPDGFDLRLGAGTPAEPQGPACLTFHTHAEVFTGQENRVYVGQASVIDRGAHLAVERQLADWSLGGGKLRLMLDFLLFKRRTLTPRVAAEAARRGQPVPRIRFPGEY